MASSDLISLLGLTESYLTDKGFSKAAAQLKKEAAKQGLALPSNPSAVTLDKVYSQWSQTQQTAKSRDANASDDSSAVSSSSDDDSSSSDSDDESSEDSSSDEEKAPVRTAKATKSKTGEKANAEKKAATLSDSARGVKRKRSPVVKSEPSSSSASHVSDSSDPESSEDEDIPATKTIGQKAKKGSSKPVKVIEVSSAEESEEDEEETDDEFSAGANKSKTGQSITTPATDLSSDPSVSSSDSSDQDSSSASDSSDSDSDSSASSDSSDESDASSTKSVTPKATKQKLDTTKSSIPGDATPSSATLSGSPVAKPVVSNNAAESSMHPSRKRKLDDSFSLTLASAGPPVETSSASEPAGAEDAAKRQKKNNIPFSRIPTDQYVDPKLASNKFVPYDYAQRAHEKLIVTKGKGFTKEKNKGKRGSYRGGKIDLEAKGIKFED